MSTKTVQGTPSWLRATNDRTALSLLLTHGPLTRNRIGELSGLSKPTASQMVLRLEEAGLIHAVGEVSAGRGPNAASYGVRVDRVLGVAIDISASVIAATLVDASGTVHPIVETSVQRPAKERTALSDVRTAIDAVCAANGADPAAVHFVCIGVQAAIDPRTDELSFTDTLPGWPRTGVRKLLEDSLGIAVTIENDVNLAALAERRGGAVAQAGGFALLWMGAGLGLAVDLGGTLHRGAGGGAGEIGYLPVPKAAAQFDPNADDLQDLIGGPAVVRLARECGLRGRGYSALIEQVGAGTHSGAGSGLEADAVITALAPRIALGVIPVLAVLDPEVVVLGGPTGIAGGAQLAERVQAHLRRTSRWAPVVVASTVATYPVLTGARELLVAEVRERLLRDVERIETP
ncbi:ROK family transcriptional regulator [Leifsonia kafniensis]|uniref:ROK family transcriptional regulator n=1 Tax=Leifsonia kafniensis TaxID=475957 RepID=A0ABP7L163_9MICO